MRVTQEVAEPKFKPRLSDSKACDISSGAQCQEGNALSGKHRCQVQNT